MALDLFEALFERGSEASLLTRPDGHIVAANARARELFGFSGEEMRMLGRADLADLDDPRLAPLVAERAATGSARGRITMRRKGGARFEADISSSIFHLGEAGAYANITVRDVTGQLRTERAQRENQERLHFILEAASIGHWDIDMQSGEGFRSPTLFAQFGVDRPPPDWTTTAFLEVVHPEDRARVARSYDTARHDGGLYEERFRVIWPDGRIHWLWAKGRVSLDAEGKPARMLGLQIDITQQQEAMLSLSESESRFRALADAAPVMIFITDANAKRLYCNSAWLAFTGLSLDEALAQRWGNLIHPDEVAAVRAGFERASRARVKYRTEYRMRNAQGRYRWLFIESQPRFDAGGQFLGYIGSCTDISDSKEAELGLRKAEERLRLVIEGSNDAPWDLLLEPGELYYSPRWWQMLGYEPDELPADATLWERIEHPDDRARTRAIFDAALAGTARIYEVEFRLRHRDGHYVPVLSRGVILRDAAGRPVRVSGTNMDLTERKQAQQALQESEARYRLLIDHLTAGVVVHGADSSVVMGNAAASEVLGLSQAQMMGKAAPDPVWSFRREDGSRMPVDEYPVMRVLASRAPLTNYVLGIDKAADCDRTWVLVSAFPKFGLERELEEVIVTFVDISALKRAEIQHDRLEAQLRESQKMEAIGTLAGGIAHDFNNIVGAILGNAELASQDIDNRGQALQSLEEIRKAGRRARDLVRQILSFSRRQPTAKQVIALPARVRDAVRLLQSTLLTQATIECSFAADVPAILADPVQVDQVLINLITNATHAMDGRAGRIAVHAQALRIGAAAPGNASPPLATAGDASHAGAAPGSALQAGITVPHPASQAGIAVPHPTAQAGTAAPHPTAQAGAAAPEDAALAGAGTPDLPPGLYAHITVRDSGQGMDAATLQRIFEPFFTTKPVGIGTGLGLSVVYGIMQAHGGAVRAESAPGQGSVFHLYFPGTSSAEPAGGPADAALPAGQGRSRRVMYIDDDEALAFLVSRLLERRGYAVSAFASPAKALAALREAPAAFDLLVSDYNMPGLTGLDVARIARQIRADLPVAIASGFITDEMRAQAAAMGIRDLIFKPNAVEEYCEVVDRLALDLER